MSTSGPISFPQVGKFHSILKQKGVDSQAFQMGFLESGLLDDLAEVIASGGIPDREELRKSLGLEPLQLKIVVQYGLDIEHMLSLGNYDDTSTQVAWSHYPKKEGVDEVELIPELVQLPQDWVNIKQVESEFEKRNLTAGGFEELLALGATYPGIQRRFPIVELGSRVQRGSKDFGVALSTDNSYVPQHHRRRYFGSQRVDGQMNGEIRFLGIRK